MQKKPITNLCITGITTCKQMKKLAKLTGTSPSFTVTHGNWENDYNRVYCDDGCYLDYLKNPDSNLTKLTWEEFLTKYSKSCCKKELKRVKKELKAFKKVPFHTDQLEDKQLVWCYDNEDIAEKTLSFWSRKHKTTFKWNGTVPDRPIRWDNYEPYKGKEPKWAKKARKKLQD